MDPWLSTLQTHHHAAGRIHWERHADGLILAHIRAPAGEGRLSLQGGQLLEWSPVGEAPVLWCSPQARFRPGLAIRGGVPVCWPWFGPHPQRPDYPPHGFARTALWEPIWTRPEGDGVALRLELVRDAQSYRLLPQRARLAMEIYLGETLTMTLETHNEDPRPLVLSQALHAYFNVSHVHEIRLHGLEGRPFVDKTAAVGRRAKQVGPVVIRGEVDRVFLQTTGPVRLEDPGLGRVILIGRFGSASTVIWNPGAEKSARMADMGEEAWRGMVCVEPANALDDGRAVPPRAIHRLTMHCRVERR